MVMAIVMGMDTGMDMAMGITMATAMGTVTGTAPPDIMERKKSKDIGRDFLETWEGRGK